MKQHRDVRRLGQRGSVSVEFALLMPVLLILVVGGVHFGRVLSTRHRLSDATGVATRSAAIKGITNANQIRNLMLNRLGGGAADCSGISVVATTKTDGSGLRRLEVTTTCILKAGFGANLLGAVGPDRLTVSAAMPL